MGVSVCRVNATTELTRVTRHPAGVWTVVTTRLVKSARYVRQLTTGTPCCMTVKVCHMRSFEHCKLLLLHALVIEPVNLCCQAHLTLKLENQSQQYGHAVF